MAAASIDHDFGKKPLCLCRLSELLDPGQQLFLSDDAFGDQEVDEGLIDEHFHLQGFLYGHYFFRVNLVCHAGLPPCGPFEGCLSAVVDAAAFPLPAKTAHVKNQ